jgi:hypothetical protein
MLWSAGMLMRMLLLALLTLASAASPASAMTYRLAMFDDGRCTNVCPQAIIAEGTIQLDEPQRLAAFIGQYHDTGLPRVVLLHSPGGNVAGAIKLGFGLRRLGARTVVARLGQTRGGGGPVLGTGICASACVFVLMGGASRLVPPGSRIFVHAAKNYGASTRDLSGGGYIDPPSDSAAVTPVLQQYAAAMGVDPALVTLVQSVPNESARLLSSAEVRRFRLASTSGPARRKSTVRRRR